jgi:hypothetical protein
MMYVLLGLALFLVLVLIAVHIGITRRADDTQADKPVLSGSGVYSIVRRSPREAVQKIRPGADEMRQYLASVNEDSTGKRLSAEDKERILAAFAADTEAAIAEVEAGDQEGVEYYYYDYRWDDPVCEGMVGKGPYVTREEMFRFPQLLPPFHLGCGCVLKRQHGTEALRKTIAMHLRPLLADNQQLPRLPDWRSVCRLP